MKKYYTLLISIFMCLFYVGCTNINKAFDKSKGGNYMSPQQRSELISKRFSYHRGLEKGMTANSEEAIKQALSKNSLFIEFDTFYYDGEMYTGHPPQPPIDPLKDVFALFKGNRTYPKIDLKLSTERNYKNTINRVLKILSKLNLKFVLVNAGGHLASTKDYMDAEEYLCSKIKDNPKIRINIDLARYRKNFKGTKKMLDKITDEHVNKMGSCVYSVSPEINEENWDMTAEFCKKHNIPVIGFWLRGWPDVPHPHIGIKKIKKAIELEKKYNVKVVFDINPATVSSDASKLRLQ